MTPSRSFFMSPARTTTVKGSRTTGIEREREREGRRPGPRTVIFHIVAGCYLNLRSYGVKPFPKERFTHFGRWKRSEAADASRSPSQSSLTFAAELRAGKQNIIVSHGRHGNSARSNERRYARRKKDPRTRTIRKDSRTIAGEGQTLIKELLQIFRVSSRG